MTKEILVAITGLQFDNSSEAETEEIKTIHAGEYYQKGDTHYVMFEEQEENTQETTSNLLKIKEGFVSLTKKGLVNVVMQFEKGKKSMTSYNTPYGNILMGMDTHLVEMTKEEEHMKVEIRYALEVNYEYLTDCTINIDVYSKEKGSEIFRP